jgi:hypothetical protein
MLNYSNVVQPTVSIEASLLLKWLLETFIYSYRHAGAGFHATLSTTFFAMRSNQSKDHKHSLDTIVSIAAIVFVLRFFAGCFCY